MANAHQKDVCTPPVSQYKPENVTLPTTAVFLHHGKTTVTHQDDRDANDKNAPVLSNHGQHTDHKTESGTQGDPCGLIDNDNLTTMFWSLKMETIDYFLMWISQRKFLNPKLFYPCPKINLMCQHVFVYICEFHRYFNCTIFFIPATTLGGT